MDSVSLQHHNSINVSTTTTVNTTMSRPSSCPPTLSPWHTTQSRQAVFSFFLLYGEMLPSTLRPLVGPMHNPTSHKRVRIAVRLLQTSKEHTSAYDLVPHHWGTDNLGYVVLAVTAGDIFWQPSWRPSRRVVWLGVPSWWHPSQWAVMGRLWGIYWQQQPFYSHYTGQPALAGTSNVSEWVVS